jgi:gliding motility-associated-like protein
MRAGTTRTLGALTLLRVTIMNATTTFTPPKLHMLGVTFLLALGAFTAKAQDCSNPTLLCPQAPETAFITVTQGLVFDCIDVTHLHVMRFRSNSNFENPGAARLLISQIICPGTAGPDSISAVVVKAGGGDPCDPAAIVSVSPCVSGVADLALQTEILEHDTEYHLIIGTRHNPLDTLCAMVVELTGEGVVIDACCNTSLVPGASVQLEATGGDPVFGYVWSPDFYLDQPTSPTPISTPEHTISYIVDGVIGDCQVSDAVTLTVGSPIEVPNSFTPNGDGINDLWTIGGIAAFDQVRVRIYDRWGQIVWRSIGYISAWDGRSNTGDLPTGTYYYSIELNDSQLNLPEEVGYVAIIR